MTFSLAYALLVATLIFLVFFLLMLFVKALYCLASGVLWVYRRLRRGRPEPRS